MKQCFTRSLGRTALALDASTRDLSKFERGPIVLTGPVALSLARRSTSGERTGHAVGRAGRPVRIEIGSSRLAPCIVGTDVGSTDSKAMKSQPVHYDLTNLYQFLTLPSARADSETEMSGTVLVSHVDGVEPTWQTQAESADNRFSVGSLGSTSASHFSFAQALTASRPVLIGVQGSCVCGAVSNSSPNWVVGGVRALQFRMTLIQKVLRFWQKGRSSSPRLDRLSSGFLFGNSLAAKGDALIHGPTLVARPVGSEWRTRHPYQVSIQTN